MYESIKNKFDHFERVSLKEQIKLKRNERSKNEKSEEVNKSKLCKGCTLNKFKDISKKLKESPDRCNKFLRNRYEEY